MDSGTGGSTSGVGGPFLLQPFRALLATHRLGDPASGRLLGRPLSAVPGRLAAWKREGRLRHDAEPALYLHEYTVGGLTVRGLVGALSVATPSRTPEERVVLPHEAHEARQSTELARRMDQMGLHPAPILLVHRGPAEIRAVVHDVVCETPWAEFTDRIDGWNRVWAIRDSHRLGVVATALAGARTLLADGHHRYAAYQQLHHAHPGTAHDQGLAMVVDQDDTPLFLGAIHRTLSRTSLTEVAAAAPEDSRVVPATQEQAMAALGPSTLAMTDGSDWARLEVRIEPGRSAVQVLHEELLPRLPGGARRLGYHHTVEEALTLLPRGGLGVLLPALGFDQVEQIVSAHRLLPEKATSFQPKPTVGVIMRSLRDG